MSTCPLPFSRDSHNSSNRCVTWQSPGSCTTVTQQCYRGYYLPLALPGFARIARLVWTCTHAQLSCSFKVAMSVQVLLLDEVTVDMDVVARLDLLEFLR